MLFVTLFTYTFCSNNTELLLVPLYTVSCLAYSISGKNSLIIRCLLFFLLDSVQPHLLFWSFQPRTRQIRANCVKACVTCPTNLCNCIYHLVVWSPVYCFSPPLDWCFRLCLKSVTVFFHFNNSSWFFLKFPPVFISSVHEIYTKNYLPYLGCHFFTYLERS